MWCKPSPLTDFLVSDKKVKSVFFQNQKCLLHFSISELMVPTIRRTLVPTNYQFFCYCGTNGEFFGLVNEFSACWNKSIKSQKQTIVRWHSHLRSKSHCYVREFKMTSFIGPYVEIIRVVFLAFLHPFIEMHLSRQRRILKWEKKGFKVSNLTMKTVPTNRYDIIMDGIIMEEW